MGKLLVLSQFILGLQLPFAVLPLLWFTTRRACLGEYAFTRVTSTFLWAIGAFIVILNGWITWNALM